jgi:hypothetical protein
LYDNEDCFVCGWAEYLNLMNTKTISISISISAEQLTNGAEKYEIK